MRVSCILILGIMFLRVPTAQCSENNPEKPNLLVIGAHPGDWEDGIGGTIWMLKDMYKINIVCASRGEMGGGVSAPSDEIGAIREGEARKAADMIGADLFFLGQVDMSVYADKYACDSLAKIAELLDPEIIFTMWAIDVPDHSACFEMAIKAFTQTGHLYSSEVYFYESDMGTQTGNFVPKFYVDISDVMDAKLELLMSHNFENPGNILEKNTMNKAAYHGILSRCKYAEGFITFLPMMNTRWDRPMKNTLLELKQ